jgi:hypothetical protein
MSRVINRNKKTMLLMFSSNTDIFIVNFILYIENLAQNGTASQSTNYYYAAEKTYLLADLAINGGPTNTVGNLGCSVTWWKPFQRFAWWMLTFPVDTVYITNVKIYYRSTGKFS